MGRTYQTQQFTYTKAALDVILTAFKTDPAAPLFPTLKLRLGQSEGFTFGGGTTLAAAQAQIATFTDYAEVAITLSGPVNLTTTIKAMLAEASWIMTTDPVVTTNTIWNYYLVSGTLLVGGEKFAGGVSFGMANVGDYLEIDGLLPLPVIQAAA